MTDSTPPRSAPARLLALAPGLWLSLAVGLVALTLADGETRLLGHPLIEGLVLAILLGMAVRSIWEPPARFDPGIDLAAKEILEVAIVLLGASVDLPLLLRAGPSLAIGIVLLVVVGLAASYGIGRLVGLPHPLAILVACGNAICGNSAIAAVAPVIRAEREQVASAIAFTAILGVVVVVGLPLLVPLLALSDYQYGVLAGLTVYAVPQVLAAAFPVSLLSGQVGTLVKLVRVLMLGPVVLFFTLTHHARPTLSLARALPWFIVGFLVVAGLRSGGVITPEVAAPSKALSGWLTILAMAALGLGVDLRSLRRVGASVIVAVSLSLVAIVGLALGLIHFLQIA